MSVSSSIDVEDLPTTDVDLGPKKIDDEKEAGPLLHCDLCDAEVVNELAQMFLPGLASASVDNTSGDFFKTPGYVADDLRKEMIDYLTQRSESFVAESVILEGDPDGEVLDHPFDIISDFVDDFASSKRNLFSRVSGWLLSEKREDKIDDFVQEMEMNGFWPLDRRETIAETLLKNVDFKNSFHCTISFNSAEDLANHVGNCNFRSMICQNEGCNAIFCAGHLEKHDSTCPFKIIPCEQKCLHSIMRREMDRHCITVCPMKLVNCPFYAVGCRYTIAQCMIEKHCSDDLHSHLLQTLKGIYREASGEDLKRRVEQIVQVSSSSRLAEAQDVRSLKFIIKDLEAKLGPLEVSAMEKNRSETIVKNEDSEDSGSDPKTKDGEQSTQFSNMVNSSDKAEVSEHSPIENKGNEESMQNSNTENLSDKAKISVVNKDGEQSTQISSMVNSSDKVEVTAILNKDSAENASSNKDSEHSPIRNKGNEEITQNSNLVNLSDKAEISVLNKDSAEIYNKNRVAAATNLKIKGNEDSTGTNMKNLSDKGEISATTEDNAENSIKNKAIEDNNLQDKDDKESIQSWKMESTGSAENILKNKDAEYD